MVSSLAKLCVHHMRLVRFPFLGLSVVTEAWQVKVRGVSILGWGKGQQPSKLERGRWPQRSAQRQLTSQRKKTNPLAEAWAQEEGVIPTEQRDNTEAVWTWKERQLGRYVSLLKTAVT